MISKNLVLGTLVCILFLFAAFGAAAQTQYGASVPEFGPAVVYGGGGAGITAGDFNGDGLPDVATTSGNADSNLISVSLNQGNGVFGVPVNYTVGYGPVGIAVGDFNGDGKLDLAVANTFSSFLSVLLGNGDGTFRPAQEVPVSLSAVGIAVGDLNGDGKLDLVAVAESGAAINLFVLLGNGDGTFQPPKGYSAGQDPVAVTVADFNNDGNLDLAVADDNSFSSGYSVLLGKGDGTFQPAISGKAGLNSNSIVAGDLNGDGVLDLAVLNYCGNSSGCFAGTISILLGKSDGTFQLVKGHTLNYTRPTNLAASDLNGDGIPDLVFSYGTVRVGVLLGEGRGKFAPETDYTVASYADPQTLAVADLNGDGQLDLAVAASNGPLGILFNNGAFPAVTLSSNQLTFPTQLVNTTSPVQRVTLTNSGTAALSISSTAATGSFQERNSCGSALGLQQSCTISVDFKPKFAGTNQGGVTITDNAPDSPQQITLSGVGTAVKLLPGSLNFGNQAVGTTSAPQTVTLTNLGPQTLTVQSLQFAGTGSGDFAETNNCASVPTNSSCAINVTFTPLATGTWTATLSVYDTDRGSPQTVSVSGTGD
ncbi:MAG TPA: FG-GAP-like repeat-containing protein [Terriglobales bacterium]